MARRRRLFWISGIFAAGVAAGVLLHYAAAGRAQDVPDEAAKRAELYTSLDREVGELERHFNVLKAVVRLASPAVVHIKAEKPADTAKPRRAQREIEEAGSGVVIELNGGHYVLTNRHVIKDALLSDIVIGLADGRELRPLKVWADPDTDVAVMSISAPGLLAAELGDSSTVEIGDFVLAIGSPFGLSHSVTYGIISAKGRRDLELGDDVELQDFLQTDAAINPGNSGGPLINLRGRVIGINTAIASNSGGNEGIGFSIPINKVADIARQFIERGRVIRGFLGVTLDVRFNSTMAVKLGLQRKQGARITRVTPGGPAEAAQLKPDDVVLRFNGVRVENAAHLIYLVSLAEVGSEVPLVAFRHGTMLYPTVKIANKSDYGPAH